MKYLILLFVLVSCSNIKTIENNENHIEKKVSEKLIATPVKEFKEQSVKVIPGQMTFIKFVIPNEFLLSELLCGGRRTEYFFENGEAVAYLAESYFSGRSPYQCKLKSLTKELVVANVKVQSFKYPSERLKVDKKRVFLSKKNLNRVLKERRVLDKIYRSGISRPLFSEAFSKPLDSFITSHYGNRRVFNNKKKSQHLGNDFRAKVGTPIPATNKGVVVFSGSLFYSGNTVILSHGLGIFTTYGHLSKLKVKKGDEVNRLDIVGLSGATGRVSGPHLHWGVKINGHWVNGFSLVKSSQEHFQVIHD